MRRRVRDYDTVLLDAMVINHFAEAGAHRALVTYLDGNLATTTIVRDESAHPRHVTPARRYILDAIEQAGRIIDPSMEEALRIDAMTQPLVEGGPRRNRGEASLIVCATSMTQRRVIVLDDRDGMRLATANDIPTCTTRRLLIEMIDSDAANEAHSWRMAQRCFNESDRRRHDLQLARHLARFRSETS